MNKNLQKLFEQAGGYIKVDHQGNEWTYTQDLDAELFGKLIANACAEIMVYSGKNDAAAEIAKHFGV